MAKTTHTESREAKIHLEILGKVDLQVRESATTRSMV